MTDEPDIVRELKDVEKFEMLQSKGDSYEKLDMVDDLYKDTHDESVVFAEDDANEKTEDIQIGHLEEKYRMIFENSAVAITVTDSNEHIVSWNKYTEQLLGMKKDDLHMMSVQSLYPPDEWKKIRSENVRQKGMQHHLETKILRKNKEPLDVDISLSVLKDRRGNVIGSIGVIRDISDRKEMERKLMSEHDLLQSLLDNIPDSIYFKDAERKFIKVNKTKASHSHVTKKDMIGKTDFDFFSEGDARKTNEDDRRVMETGKPIVNKTEKITDKNGLERWVSVTKIPRYDTKGSIVGTMGISRDITLLIMGENELKESEERYRRIFENSAVAIMLTNENEKIISWNKYTESLLGKDKDELYMKPVESLYPAEEWQKIRSQNVRQKGMQHHLETKIFGKNNEMLDVDISLSVLKNNEGKVIGSIGVIKDISEQKQAEKKLNEAYDLLSDVNIDLEKKVEERISEVKKLLKQKNDLVCRLGHDLKTPLSVLVNMLPMISEEVENPDIKEDCKVTIRNVNYIKSIVAEILKIAELNSSEVKLDIQDINLLDLVNNIIMDNQLVFEKENIKIENKIDKKIIVKADQLGLFELFNNLISNAVKYTQDDIGTITIDAHKDKDIVTISVKDTGMGMTNDQLDLIFDECYKVDDSRHNLESCGFGLSICKHIVQKHGGKIWAESPGEGKGSTFYFTLKAHKNKNSKDTQLYLGHKEMKKRMRKKIMIVDDNSDLIFTVKKALERSSDDYNVTGANDGKECFELLKKDDRPDIILLDIMMPGIDGWQVFAKLKENPKWREIPIVFLTAKTDEYSKGFGKLSSEDYIEKPFEIEDLKERINKILKR
jgi:PAS domain S-box-containing protein